jgi:hypothetical protein
MLDAEMSAQMLARQAGVDVKSVTRWISEGRVPHPSTRAKVAHLLNQQETFLWPSLLETAEASDVAASELNRIWRTRSAVSTETWHSLFNRTSSELDILVYAGGFLIETLDLADIIRWKASTGTKVRVLLGDPESAAVRTRATELSLSWLPERCRTTAHYLDQVSRSPGVSVRLHATTLYASHYRFDDVVLVNDHAFGVWACQSPVYQLRRAMNGHLFDFYVAAFNRVWAASGCGAETNDPKVGSRLHSSARSVS